MRQPSMHLVKVPDLPDAFLIVTVDPEPGVAPVVESYWSGRPAEGNGPPTPPTPV